MCLFPRFIKNKRYLGYNTKRPARGGATAVPCDDYRKLYVPIGCGNCYECRRQKAQAWRVRLMEEIKVQKHKYFVTLTFSNEELSKLAKELGKEPDTNDVATLAVRRFLERWRKKHKRSVKHWLITELGHENTERIHLHGVLFTEKEIDNNILCSFWKYGKTDIGQYCNERTINYIVKYVTKIDVDHKGFVPVILCSARLGAAFLDSVTARDTYKYRPQESAEYYTLNDGNKVALPIYYRNKLYTQEERDKMWTDRLDKATIYVNGIECKNVNTAEGYEGYCRTLKQQQKINSEIGYGNASDEWKKKSYKVTFDMVNASGGKTANLT